MAKRKVLFVVNHLTIGGVQKSLISALNSLDYEKNDVTLYLRKNRTTLLPFVNENVNVIINEDPNHYYRSFTCIRMQAEKTLKKMFGMRCEGVQKKLDGHVLAKRMEYEKTTYFDGRYYDVAIAYVQGHPALFVSDCVEAGQKIVFYQGSTDELHEVHEEAFPKFDRFVVEHEDIKNALCSWYEGLEGKTTILDNYTDHKLIRRLGAEKVSDTDHNGAVFCTCARFEYVKGIDIAVEAARRMRDDGYKFVWYLVGDGRERAKVEALVQKYDLSDHVILTGMQTNPYPYMAHADIYVQPSREEALSISMLESQILCVPMASTATSGGIAMVEEGVSGAVSKIDPDDLAKTIERLWDDEPLRMRIKGYLESIDYTPKETAYRNAWAKLLGDKQ